MEGATPKATGGRIRAWSLALALLAHGCAGPGVEAAAVTAKPPSAHAAAPASEALSLLEVLPGNADRCALGSPALLTVEQAAALSALGLTERFLWDLPFTVERFAVVARVAPGARARALAFVTDASKDQVEQALRNLNRFQVRVGGEAAECGPDACPLVLGFPAAGVVRLTLGRFFGATVRSETVRDCVSLAREPGAVAVLSERVMPTMGPAVGPLQVRLLARASDAGLDLLTRDVFVDGEAAQDALSLLPFHSLLRNPVADLMGTRQASRDGRQVEYRQHLSATDLSWLVADGATRTRGLRYGELLGALAAATVERSQSEQDYLRGLEAYAAVLAEAQGPMPQHPLVDAARTYADRAAAAHPQSETLAKAVASLRASLSRQAQADRPTRTPNYR